MSTPKDNSFAYQLSVEGNPHLRFFPDTCKKLPGAVKQPHFTITLRKVFQECVNDIFNEKMKEIASNENYIHTYIRDIRIKAQGLIFRAEWFINNSNISEEFFAKMMTNFKKAGMDIGSVAGTKLASFGAARVATKKGWVAKDPNITDKLQLFDDVHKQRLTGALAVSEGTAVGVGLAARGINSQVGNGDDLNLTDLTTLGVDPDTAAVIDVITDFVPWYSEGKAIVNAFGHLYAAIDSWLDYRKTKAIDDKLNEVTRQINEKMREAILYDLCGSQSHTETEELIKMLGITGQT